MEGISENVLGSGFVSLHGGSWLSMENFNKGSANGFSFPIIIKKSPDLASATDTIKFFMRLKKG